MSFTSTNVSQLLAKSFVVVPVLKISAIDKASGVESVAGRSLEIREVAIGVDTAPALSPTATPDLAIGVDALPVLERTRPDVAMGLDIVPQRSLEALLRGVAIEISQIGLFDVDTGLPLDISLICNFARSIDVRRVEAVRQEVLATVATAISRLRYVKQGDYVLSGDINDPIEALENIYTLAKWLWLFAVLQGVEIPPEVCEDIGYIDSRYGG